MKENRSKQIIIRVTPSEEEIISKAAEQDERTKSDFGRRCMIREAQKILVPDSN